MLNCFFENFRDLKKNFTVQSRRSHHKRTIHQPCSFVIKSPEDVSWLERCGHLNFHCICCSNARRATINGISSQDKVNLFYFRKNVCLHLTAAIQIIIINLHWRNKMKKEKKTKLVIKCIVCQIHVGVSILTTYWYLDFYFLPSDCFQARAMKAVVN